MDETNVRELRLVGPPLAESGRFLWVADLTVEYLKALPADGGLMRNAALRVLAERAKRRDDFLVREGPFAPSRKIAFFDPLLLTAAVRADRGTYRHGTLWLGAKGGDTPRYWARSRDVASFAPADESFALVVATPLTENRLWPDKEQFEREIESPPLSLLSGEIPVYVQDEAGDDDLWTVLRADDRQTRTAADREEYVAILATTPATEPNVYVRCRSTGAGAGKRRRLCMSLTALGIEFDALIRDPFGIQAEPLMVRLRVEPGEGRSARLVLVEERSAEPGPLRKALDQMLLAMVDADAPLSIRLQEGSAPLEWPLERGSESRPLAPYIPDYDWPRLRKGSITADLITQTVPGATQRAVASLRSPLGSVRFHRPSGRRWFCVEAPGSAAAGAPPQAVQVVLASVVTRKTRNFDTSMQIHLGEATAAVIDRVLADGVGENLASRLSGHLLPASVHVDVGEVGRAAQARYSRSGVRGTGQSDPLSVFVALERGAMQLPIAMQPVPPHPPTRDPVSSTFSGQVQVSRRFPSSSDVPTTVSLRACTAVAAVVSFDAVSFEQASCAEFSARLSGALGICEGGLWLSERSPTAEEAVPTLDTGPIALCSLKLQLGKVSSDSDWGGYLAPLLDRPPDRICLRIRPAPALSDLPQPPHQVVHWKPVAAVPLVSAMNMTRSAPNAPAPSQTRDLVPIRYTLKAPAGNADAGLEIQFDLGRRLLPRASVTLVGRANEVHFGWEDLRTDREKSSGVERKQLSVPMLPLTLPGTELVPEKSDVPDPELLSSLRADLPILGELFSATPGNLLRDPLGTGEGNGTRLATALDLPAMESLWRESARRLARTRTRNDRLTPWDGGPVQNLVEPHEWSVRFEFRAAAVGGALPLGAYRLGRDEQDWVSGETALRGGPDAAFTVGPGGTLLPGDQLRVKGFAVTPYPVDGDGVADTRGLIQAREATVKAGWTQRAFELASPHTKPELTRDRHWVSTTRAIPLQFASGNAAELWVRDLPTAVNAGGNLQFDAAPKVRLTDDDGRPAAGAESALGPQLSAFDRHILPQTRHEWRLFATPPVEVPRHELLVAGLRFRPLRLWQLVFGNDDRARKAVILFSVVLPEVSPAPDPREVFAPEDPFSSGNTVAVTFEWKDGVEALAPVSIAPVDVQGDEIAILRGSAALVNFDLRATIVTGRPTSELQRAQHEAEDRPARLGFELEVGAQDGVRIRPRSLELSQVRLFGCPCTLSHMSNQAKSGGGLSATWTAQASSGDGLTLTRVVVDVSVGEPPRIQLEGGLNLDDGITRASRSCPVSWSLGKELRWWGVTIDPSCIAIAIDHSRGAVQVSLKPGSKIAATPFRGMSLETVDVQGILAATLHPVSMTLASVDPVPASATAAAAIALAAVRFEARAAANQGLLLRHLITTSSKGSRLSRLTLTLRSQSRESVIGWPVAAVAATGSPALTKTEYHGQPSTGETLPFAAGTTPLVHRVTAQIIDARLDAALLDRRGAQWIMTQPWHFKAFVEHELVGVMTLAGTSRKLRWSSLDDLCIFDLAGAIEQMHKDSTSGVHPRPYAFSPRYRQAVEGGQPADTADVPSAGLVGSGMLGPVLTRVVAGQASSPWPGLAILGGSVVEVPLDKLRTSGPVLAMPWLAPLLPIEAAQAPLAPLSSISQTPTGGGTYQVAAFDLAGAIPLPLDPDGVTPFGIGRGRVPDIAAALSAVFGGICPPEATTLERAFASNLPGPPTPWAGVDPLSAPIFWRSLMALARIARSQTATTQWARQESEGIAYLQAATLISAPSIRRAARLAIDRSGEMNVSAPPEPSSSTEAAQLIAIDRSGVHTLRLSAAEARALVAPRGDSLHRLARWATTVTAAPLLLHAGLADDAEPHDLSHLSGLVPIELPVAFDELPEPRPLRARTDAIHASPCLGWPRRGRFGERGRELSLAEERPFQDPTIAWAGRARSVGASLACDAEDKKLGDGGTFLAIGRRVLFDRNPAGAQPIPFRAPPDRALMPIAPRVRVPLAKALESALLAQHVGQTSGMAPFFPGRFETITTGARPGVLFLEHEGLLLAGRSAGFDARNERFGRPADRAPTLIHQGRAPRSTGLPPGIDLQTLRRTFLGLNLREPGNDKSLAPFGLIRGNGTVLRYVLCEIRGDQTDERPFAVIVSAKVVNATDKDERFLDSRFTGKVKLRFQRPADLADGLCLEGVLGALGILRSHARAWLRVDSTSMPFEVAEWRAEGADEVVLTLSTSSERSKLTLLNESIRNASADSRAALQVQFRPDKGQTASPSPITLTPPGVSQELADGPPRLLTIPLSLAPSNRAWLAIESATVAFGDAAYDRELAGPAKTYRKSGAGDNRTASFLLALDRFDYDLGETIFFAFGAVNPKFLQPRRDPSDDRPFAANVGSPPIIWSLTIEVIPKATKDLAAPARELWVSGVARTEPGIKVAVGKEYSVVIADLVEKDSNAPAKLESGDRLRLSLRAGRLVTGTFMEEASIPALSVDVGVVARPVLAPPSSVYGIVTLEAPDTPGVSATPALFASAPLPQTIEHVDLLGDLVRGHVRRRGLFVWRFVPRNMPETAAQPLAGLVKFDRTGGGQIPNRPEDFSGFMNAARPQLELDAAGALARSEPPGRSR